MGLKRRPIVKPARAPIMAVPKRWPGETFVCICCGPSLTQDDVDHVRGKARVIVVNDAYKMAPWADVLYACDGKWWNWHKGAASFQGLKYTLALTDWPGLQRLENTGRDGLELKPTGVRTASNSGYQAVNLAVHLGASRIVLLGYDMQKSGGLVHCFGDHPQKSQPKFESWINYFNKLAPILKKQGVDVVNCTRTTALKCFPKADLRHVLPESMAVAS